MKRGRESEGDEKEGEECCVCMEPTDDRTSPCHHPLCRSCYGQLTSRPRACPMCRRSPIRIESMTEAEEQAMNQQQQQHQQRQRERPVTFRQMQNARLENHGNSFLMRNWVYDMYDTILDNFEIAMDEEEDEDINGPSDAMEDQRSMGMELCRNPNPHVRSPELLTPELAYHYDQMSANPVLFMQVPPDQLHWDMMATNPNPRAIQLVRQLQQHQPNHALFRQHNRLLILQLCDNPNQTAIAWLQELVPNPAELDEDCWQCLSANPAAVALLEAHPEKIDWFQLSKNPSPFAIQQLEAHPERIDWMHLSQNPAAIHLLQQHPDRIDNVMLLINPHPDMMPIIEQHIQNNDTDEDHMRTTLFSNPAIFTDYTWRLRTTDADWAELDA